VFTEVTQLGSVLSRLAAVAEDPVHASVAVLWDAESAWALAGPGLPAPDLDHSGRVAEVHAALRRLGHTTDVVPAGTELTPYRAVFVPGAYIASAASAAALRSYVDGGGTAVVFYFSGIVDESGRVWPGAYPGAYRDVLGVRVTEIDPVPPGERVGLSTGDTAGSWTEVVELAGAEAVVSYADGRPAVTRHRYGRGVAWYVSTRLDPSALTRVLTDVLGADSAEPADGLDLVRRGALLFAINNSAGDRRVAVSGVDVLTGEPVDGSLTVPAGAVAVIGTGSRRSHAPVR
jgi:beta-galactosidase